jgi:hypothetical protein
MTRCHLRQRYSRASSLSRTTRSCAYNSLVSFGGALDPIRKRRATWLAGPVKPCATAYRAYLDGGGSPIGGERLNRSMGCPCGRNATMWRVRADKILRRDWRSELPRTTKKKAPTSGLGGLGGRGRGLCSLGKSRQHDKSLFGLKQLILW